MSAHFSVVGTVGTSPRLLRTATDVALCSFRLAHTTRRYDRSSDSWADGETSWFTVNAFRGLGEHAAASLTRGDRVLVAGRLRMRAWQSGDRSGITAEIEADAVGPDLRWGTTQFTPETPPVTDQNDPAQPDTAQPDAAQSAASGASSAPAAGLTAGDADERAAA